MLPLAYFVVVVVVDLHIFAAVVVEVYVPDSIVHTRLPAAFSLQRQLNLEHHHQCPSLVALLLL